MYSHDTPVAGSISSVGHPSMLKWDVTFQPKEKEAGETQIMDLIQKKKAYTDFNRLCLGPYANKGDLWGIAQKSKVHSFLHACYYILQKFEEMLPLTLGKGRIKQ